MNFVAATSRANFHAIIIFPVISLVIVAVVVVPIGSGGVLVSTGKSGNLLIFTGLSWLLATLRAIQFDNVI